MFLAVHGSIMKFILAGIFLGTALFLVALAWVIALIRGEDDLNGFQKILFGLAGTFALGSLLPAVGGVLGLFFG